VPSALTAQFLDFDLERLQQRFQLCDPLGQPGVVGADFLELCDPLGQPGVVGADLRIGGGDIVGGVIALWNFQRYARLAPSRGNQPSGEVNSYLSDDPGDRKIFARGVFDIALEDMALQLKASDFYQGRLDLSPVGLFHPKALEALIHRGTLAPEGAQSATRRRLALTSLVRLPVFLDTGDDISRLVGLAANDEGFSRWRRGMTKALADIEGLDPTDSYFRFKVQTAFENALSDAVEGLAESARNATWQGALKLRRAQVRSVFLRLAPGSGLPSLPLPELRWQLPLPLQELP
jgi:hypothetical protein